MTLVNNLHQCSRCKEIFEIADVLLLEQPCPNCERAGGWLQVPLVLVCDFCSIPTGDHAVWTYPAEDFFYSFQIEDAKRMASKGDWAACEECHALIEAGDYEAVAVRSTASSIEQHGPESMGERRFFFGLALLQHDDFRKHRTGDAIYETAREHYERKEREQ